MLPLLPLRRLTSLLLLCGVLSPLSPLDAANLVIAKPALLLAQNYDPSINPAHYLVSEKLDGVRAVWDGKTFRFRSGQIIHAPAWFIEKFPAHAMDGELWMGRRRFDEVSGVVRRLKPVDSDWKAITYHVYELPAGAGSFSDRLRALDISVAEMGVSWVKVLEQFTVKDERALDFKLQQIARAGGEGLMLHRADAPWQTGRSDVLLKLKKQWDAEARVIAYLPGRGKYHGMLGALVVETLDGKRFNLGTGFSDEQRKSPPEIGSKVTYRYRDLTPQGVPRFANFLRVREHE